MGLKKSEIEQLREKYGYNEIKRKKVKTKFEVLIDVLNDPILIIMIVAALISFATNFEDGHFAETYVILVLVIVNVIISFVQDIKTIEKLKALDELNEDTAIVIRDDVEEVILAKELLPGDLVKIKTGIIARADMVIVEQTDLRVDESFLTGESEEVEKEVDQLIYSNSQIKNGIGLALVTEIGLNTRIGQIAKDVDDVDETDSQLEKKIRELTKFLLKLSFVIAVIVFILSMLNNEGLDASLSITISILIATVPEGLATVLTIVLTSMSSKMAQNNALIKKVDLVETLGEVSFVCSDKTGTITENKMSVSEVEFFDEELKSLIKFCIKTDSPTSNAIYEHSRNYDDGNFEVIDMIAFSSILKKEVQLIKSNDKKYIVEFGAPDFVIENISELTENYNKYAESGLRTLLFSYCETDLLTLDNYEELDVSLKPLALYGIYDAPKQSAIDAIKVMHEAGIEVVMITGDSAKTAQSIAIKANIIHNDDDIVITGEELNKMDDIEFNEKVEHIKVYARTQPEDKVRIVRMLQYKGNVVAMTGDGTNDSIALKQANVGVAMGINGTDISKESADLILLDDNFATITEAIKGGRQIFDNLAKFVRQMLTSNAAHTGSIIFALLFTFIIGGGELLLPMTPVLILWVNIISDAIPCLALGIEQAEADVLTRDPIDPKKPILQRKVIVEILIRGLSLGLLVYLAFNFMLNSGYSEFYSRSVGFVILSFGQLIHIFDSRSFKTIFLKNPFNNRLLNYAILLSSALNLMIIYLPINNIFGLEAISITHLLIAIVVSSSVTFVYSLIKLAIMKFKNNSTVQ